MRRRTQDGILWTLGILIILTAFALVLVIALNGSQ